jgi:hypothetical protein
MHQERIRFFSTRDLIKALLFNLFNLGFRLLLYLYSLAAF